MAFLSRLITVVIISRSPFFAAAQDFRGALLGTVNDASGARIPAASISANSDSSHINRQAKSNQAGEFRIDDLSPGTYRFTVNAPGLAKAESIIFYSGRLRASALSHIATGRSQAKRSPFKLLLRPSLPCPWTPLEQPREV